MRTAKISMHGHDYSVSRLWNEGSCKDHPAGRMTCAQFCCLVGGVLSPGKLLSSPREAVADPLPKHLLLGWGSSPVQLLLCH